VAKPIFNVFAIPTPPDTCNAPVPEDTESVVLDNVATPDAEIVVKAPELGVVLPMELGLANVFPFNKLAFRLATFALLVTVIDVKAPELGVVLPMELGLANVFPFKKEQFKFGTLVVEETVNGAVPVETVLVNVFPNIEDILLICPPKKLDPDAI
jgi:hypothetical protein